MPAVRVDGLSKSFSIPREGVHTLKERVLHPMRRPGTIELAALKDISFTVAAGEFYAVVGRNGSGKSTLLKCLAGIYAADRGRIYVDGRLSSFIELGVGFNPDLPARDNVMLNATMLGLSPRQAARRFDAVIDFAELREFVDLKLKNYSSGMQVRLAFSVMIQADADVLLIDEVLAVGDVAFQQKCHDEFDRMRDRGSTVILVTHDMAAAQRFCDRAMLLDRGDPVEIGDIERIADRYYELNFGAASRRGEPGPAEAGTGAAGERIGDGTARIVDAWFESDAGERSDALPVGEHVTHAMRVVFAQDTLNPVFSVIVEDLGGAVVVTADAGYREVTGRFEPGDEVLVRTRFLNVLAPGRYDVTPGVARGGELGWIDRPARLQQLTVTGTRRSAGIVDLPYEVRLERIGRESVR